MLALSIAGTVGRDAETRAAGSTTVTNFSVAISGYDFKAKQKTTTWVRVAVWGKRGEQLESMVTKGSRVACSGQMSLSEYNGKTSLELNAQDVSLLGGGAPTEYGRPELKGSKPAPDEDSEPPF